MSYQVLARKWRPRNFAELVGQEHVVRPLTHALDESRLHHALLFTGTRGVGKTTIARIFAKALNCEQGVSSTPCGQCVSCREVDEGRFVDLIEIDAASRTKVEDTRELLDNVQYAPSRGRHKVYLIDEVHMLSNHSFNALLKTLEEPPPHVKFILATTDPQRLPITILSRCLQFNLKCLPTRLIAEHLSVILNCEGIPYDDDALHQIARAGDGSMRDALTLLDQAIAFGAGRIEVGTVAAMLGTIDLRHVLALLDALATRDAKGVIEAVTHLDESAPDYDAVLAELLRWLQRIAIVQAVPEADFSDDCDPEALQRLAQVMAAEDIQLYYQIALLGRRDLPLVPDARAGLEMTLLRMLCFSPESILDASASSKSEPVPNRSESVMLTHSAEKSPLSPLESTAGSVPVAEPVLRPAYPAPIEQSANDEMLATSPPQSNESVVRVATLQSTALRQSEDMIAKDQLAAENTFDLGGQWNDIVERLGLRGITAQLARHCVVQSLEGKRLTLRIEASHAKLRTNQVEAQLREALQHLLGQPLQVQFSVGEVAEHTPARLDAERQAERQREALMMINEDPNIQALQRTFNAELKEDSVKPLD